MTAGRLRSPLTALSAAFRLIFPPLPPEPAPLRGEALHRRVRLIELRARRALRDQLAGEYRSAFRGQGLEFADVRPYAPGDDVRSIDWKATARLREPYVRRYVEERQQTVLLLVDVSASTAFGRRGQSVRDVGLEIAATLGLAAARGNDHVGAVAFSDRIEYSVAPSRRTQHVWRIIRDLLVQSGTGTDLAGAFDYAGQLLRRRTIIVIISDFVADQPPEIWRAALRRLGLRHDVVAIAVRHSAESALPGGGIVQWSDSESGAALLADRERAAAQTAALQRERHALEQQLRGCGVDALVIDAERDWTTPLLGLLRERQRRP